MHLVLLSCRPAKHQPLFLLTMKEASTGNMAMKNERYSTAGQSTLEMLVALVILIMSIAAAVLIIFTIQSSSVDTKVSQEALYRAQQELEKARAQARENFASLPASSSTN